MRIWLLALAVLTILVSEGSADFVLLGDEHLDVTSASGQHAKGVLFDSSTAHVRQGGLISRVFANNDSSLTLSDGRIGNFDVRDNSSVEISGGTSIGLHAYDSSSIVISGGDMSSRLTTHDTSSASITGGKMQSLEMTDSSEVHLSGGSMRTLSAYGTSSLKISGGEIATELYVHVDNNLSNRPQTKRAADSLKSVQMGSQHGQGVVNRLGWGAVIESPRRRTSQ